MNHNLELCHRLFSPSGATRLTCFLQAKRSSGSFHISFRLSPVHSLTVFLVFQVTISHQLYPARKLKGKVLDSCVVPASTYGLETLALSELHQHKLQVCENNWIRKIAGVRRVERRRMKDLREEVGSKACIVGKIVKSRMKWAGHMVRMNDDKLPKRAETKTQEGSRKRGRPQLRWEDCVKRDLRKAKEEEKWREKANNRDRWKLITKVAVLRSDQ